jgi:predicted SAM-dependent methyltransferase
MKLQLGCGPYIKEGFINYDLNPGPGGIVHDLTKPLPHPDNSVDLIFSEHFIEHITREQAVGLLKESYRVLKPGGKIRITTPDLRIITKDYLDRKIDRWKGGWEPATPAQMMNYGLTSWGHQFTYDKEELAMAFREAGFKAPYLAPHGELEIRAWFSEITMEAIK